MGKDQLLKTALHNKHLALEAKMGEEGGWSVPLSYRGALEEASEVRQRTGVFDLSHYGRIRIRGGGALDLLERACTADVAHQEDNTTLPTLLCAEDGGIIDSARLIRLSDFWVLVTSPINRQKVLEHLSSLVNGEGFGVKVDDQTPKTSMLAAVGPETPEILDSVLPFTVSDLSDGAVKFGSLMIARYIAERVSLTGQWCAVVTIPNLAASQAWKFITAAAGKAAIRPAGLAALDVLRIEEGLPRYGHEINETVDPITAALERYVDFGHDFLGCESVKKLAQRPPPRKSVGLSVAEKDQSPKASQPRIPRLGSTILTTTGREVGTITSGTFSTAMNAPIALGYVSPESAEIGTELIVKVDDHELPAKVTPLPFVPVAQ